MKRIQIPFAGGLNPSAIEAGSGHPLIMIPGAEVDILPEAEGGSHFMFAENPARFNARVAAFSAK